VEERAGTSEQLAVVFVALARGMGWLARLVNVLNPAPLKPDDASLVRSMR
jgi:hypothetical protein